MTRVLLIEDDPDIRSIADMALSTVGGMTVTPAEDGPAGLAVLDEAQPDVVLLDVMMPGMDGLQVLAAIRDRPAWTAVPVIFMTARVRPREVESYHAAGAAGVISKPFDPMTLAEDVRRLITDAVEAKLSQSRYAPLVRRFLDGLRERRAQMAAGLEDLEGEGFETLRAEVHRIAGTAGSMGFLALGEAAVALETAMVEGAPEAEVRDLHAILDALADGLRMQDSRLIASED